MAEVVMTERGFCFGVWFAVVGGMAMGVLSDFFEKRLIKKEAKSAESILDT